MASKALSLLEHHQVGRRFDDTEHAGVAVIARTERADGLVGEGIALTAMADGLKRLQKTSSEQFRPRPIVLQHMQSHALCRFGPNTWEPCKGIGQRKERGRRGCECAFSQREWTPEA